MSSSGRPLLVLGVGIVAGVACAEAARAVVLLPLALLALGFGVWVCRRGSGPSPDREAASRSTHETNRERPATRETVSDLALAACEAHPDAAALLARSVAHDLNNLLAVVSGCTFQLEPHVGCDAAAGEHLRSLEAVTTEAGHAARRLYAIARTPRSQPRSVPANVLVSRLLTNRRALFGADVACVTNLAADAGRVRVDEGPFELAILSMILAARDGMGGGQVSLATRRHRVGPGAADEWVEFAVEFAPRGPAGDAPGVALVQSVVARFGGSVSVEPRSRSGARVAIRLPAEPEPVEVCESRLAERRSGT
jgi:signal transduction histidine kinase